MALIRLLINVDTGGLQNGFDNGYNDDRGVKTVIIMISSDLQWLITVLIMVKNDGYRNDGDSGCNNGNDFSDGCNTACNDGCNDS